MHKTIYLMLAIVSLGAPGCSAVTTAIEHRDLVVENKMTDTVFLDPVSVSQRTVFLQIRNTTDRQDFDLDSELRQAITAKGYTVTNDPSHAHYLLQANVLQVGKVDKQVMWKWFADGYGGASVIGTTAYGAGLGAAVGGWGGILPGALIAAPVALVADAFVKDNNYAAITDIQISERTSTRVTDRTNQRLKQGSAGHREVTSEQTTDQKVYQTRVLSSADRVNLELEEAMPMLKAGITRSTAGIF